MKIIHCSDAHLDSAMERNLSQAQARERNAEICATFGRLVKYAAENQVDAVLIAGDLFDTDRVSARTADYVMERIRGAETVEFFYLRGNHDEAADVFAGMELPDNFKTFGKKWVRYHRGEVAITGLELDRENWEDAFDRLVLDPEDINIVMLHGQISTQSGEELIPLPKLRGRHIDYLALGHIHSYQKEKLDDRGDWCYCGCPEGRGFDECGEKGFVLLDIQDRQIRSSFVPFARRRLEEVTVDITDLTTVSQLQTAMEQAAKDISSESMVKFTLSGSYTLETQKDLGFLRKMLEPNFYFVKIKDESHLKIEKESYEHDVSLKGEFIRMVMASDKSPEEKEQIILWGIRALAGEEVEP